MRWMQPSAYLRCFFTNEQASALPMIAVGLVVMVGAAGVAIDTGRSQIVQSRMQTALDAAGLAVGSEISSTNINTETSKYFYANFPTGYLGSIITSGPMAAVTPNASGGISNIISLAVNGQVPNTFMQVFGINYTNVAASTQVNRQSNGLELVLVMDNTGSMNESAGGSVSKIDASKTAVQALLASLYGSNSTIPNLWVGVVPFSQTVNVGASNTAWLDTAYDSTLNWGTSAWGGCVEARANGSLTPQLDVTDDPPSVKPFRQYYAPCNTDYYFGNVWYGNNASSYNNCLRTGGTVHYQSTSTTTIGPNVYCPVPIQPMVAEKATVQTTVNNMQATGGTHIDLGVAWGWRMLSPRWRTLWGGEMNSNSLPLNYNTPLMTKVMVLMTDGDNTLYGNGAATSGTDYQGVYTGYGFTNTNALSVSGSECNSNWDCTNGQNELNKRTLAACSAMKANGILIYTIALGAEVSAGGQALLQGCATNPSYYFLSPTTDALQTIFQQIGDSLSNLRISQ